VVLKWEVWVLREFRQAGGAGKPFCLGLCPQSLGRMTYFFMPVFFPCLFPDVSPGAASVALNRQQ